MDFYEEEKYTDALLCYDSLIKIDSTNGEYYFKRGNCKMLLDNNVGAIEDYSKSIEFNYSRKQSAYLNIAVIHRFHAVFISKNDNDRVARYDSALHFYNECLKIDPENEKAQTERKEVIESLRKLRN